MPATTLKAYLIIAHYDHEEWTRLDEAKRKQAERLAEQLFPQRYAAGTAQAIGGMPDDVSTTDSEALGEQPLPYPPGVRLVQTFHSGFHALVPPGFVHKPANMPSESSEDRDAFVLEVLEGLPPTIQDARAERLGLQIDEPRIGWVAVVDAEALPEFVGTMGGKTGPLWKMYKIQLIPLNDDRTTADIYSLMTPVHWSS